MRITTSTFTGDAEGSCGNSGSGIQMIYADNSYIALDDVTISDNGYGVFFKQSSGEITNSNININCAAVNTNGFKQTGSIKHTLTINDNTLTTAEGAGITAYDQARISASRNTISGAEQGSESQSVHLPQIYTITQSGPLVDLTDYGYTVLLK